MSDINVALTTTGHTVAVQDASEFLKVTKDADIPVCVANIGLGMFGFGINAEQFELRWAQICIEMAKTVQVDVEKKTVFVGEDPTDTNTGLVEYTELGQGLCASDFFRRWNETHTMVFEFSALNLKGDPLFAIKGIWMQDHWHDELTILSGETLHILSKHDV